MREVALIGVQAVRLIAKKRMVIALLTAITSCDTPGIRLVNPDFPDRPTGVTFHATLEDSSLAEAFGWEGGVPDATVYLQRVGEPFQPDSLTTDSLGQAHLPDILPGQFKVAAHRLLNENETGPTAGVVRAFGDGRILTVGRGDTASMALVVDEPGSLVFSEWFLGTDSQGYYAARHIELYNNADTTVYLDGMLLGSMWAVVGDILDFSCAESESWRNDPLGVWSVHMHKFPGSGHDFPVASGQTVVVATDAVDHSVVHSGLPDLSNADFEFEGTADADNPDVPNMPHLGPGAMTPHGLTILSSLFLALATEFETLDRRRSFRGHEYDRVPNDRLLDVVRIVHGFSHRVQLTTPPCGISVPRILERLEGGEAVDYADDLLSSAHRRILRTTSGGHVVLQDVNTSFVDFVHGPRNPGRVEW